MKPLFLSISGLNSFREEQHIDFTQLCGAGLFGIFGPTGSGKSTVLDAITLALYGRVERAERGIQGIINQHQDSAAVQFKFALGERVFTAERSYKRSKDGGIRTGHCRLLEHTAEGVEVLADKAREMDQLVEDIIGLKADDFTRAVVLPQGKFAEFLTLQDRERREMLERLFGLEKYGEQLSKRIRHQLAKAKTEWEMLARQQGELGDASPQALQQAEENLQQQQKILGQIQREYKQKQQQLEEYKELRQWQGELQDWLAKEQHLAAQAPAMEQLADKIQQAQRANQVKPYLDKVQAEQTALNDVQQRLAQLDRQVKQADEAYGLCQQRQQNLQQQMQQQGQQWQTQLLKLEAVLQQELKRDTLQHKYRELQQRYKTLAKQSQDVQAAIDKLTEHRTQLLQQQQQLQEQIEQNNVSAETQQQLAQRQEAWRAWQEALGRLTELQRELTDQQRQLAKLDQSTAHLQQQVEDIEQALAAKEQLLTNLSPPDLTQQQLNERRETVNKAALVVHTLKLRQQELEHWEQQQQQQQRALEQLEQQIIQRRQRQADLLAQGQQLTKQLTALEEQYKQSERQNLALLLSQQLQPDQPCPVCGSTHHPQPASGDRQGLAQIQEQLEQIRAQLTELESAQKQLDSQLTADEALCQRQGEELAKTDQQRQTVKETVAGLRRQLDAELAGLPLPQLEQRLAQQQQQLQQLQQHIDSYTKEREQLQQQKQQLQSQLHQLQQQAAGLAAQRNTLQQQLEAVLTKQQYWQQQLAEKEQNFKAVAAGMDGAEIEAALAQVREKLKLLEQLRQRQQQLNQQLEQTVNELLNQQQQFQQLKQQLEALTTEGRACKEQLAELTEEINQVTGGEKAALLKAALEEKIANLKEELHKAEQQLEQQRLKREEIHRHYYATTEQQRQLQQRLSKAKEELADKLAEQHFVTAHQAEQALCHEAEIAAMQQQLNSYQQEKVVVSEHIKQLQGKLAGRSITDEFWEEFLQGWQATEERLEKAKETVAKLTDRLATLQQNHRRWQQLEEKKLAQQDLTGKLQQLAELFRGNAFVQFIAEEQLLNVVMEASQRLGELTHNKYALELSADGNFVIRDDANGGMKRAVTTLSGGETFLTSLALALALSNQIQLRGQYPLEFFFLDEGFGTLDPELLETVMNSLERLHSQQMTIGVISHVAELRFRINRRLVVEPAEKGGRGTRVSLELA